MNQRTKLVLASKHVNVIIHELIPWYIHSWYNYVVWSMRCNQFDYKWSILCLIRGKCLMKYVIIICIFVSVYSRKDEVNNWIFNWWQPIAIRIKLFLIFWQHLKFVYVFNKDKVSKCFTSNDIIRHMAYSRPILAQNSKVHFCQ